MKLVKIPTMFIVIFSIVTAFSQVPYETQPDWLSVEDSDYGTGCAFDDINADGFIDLAVSNGNDMALAPNYIYINQDGVLPNAASWISDDERLSGHCEFGDINGDGYPELMVANYISPGWEPATVQVYYNDNGILETYPSWETSDSIYSFRASFGDADSDGDLDLAVATGEAYHNVHEQNLIYYNIDGLLQTDPGWVSDDYDASYDVQFVDIDDDDDLDVAFLTSGGPVKIYYNYGDSIETTPAWQSTIIDNGNSFDFADLNGDGYLDLGVAYNTQHNGSGRFVIYYSENGMLHTYADWFSSSSGYGSEAVFSDVDNDGDYDLVTGRWFGLIYIYLNDSGVFSNSPDWISSPDFQLVVENIDFGDVDNGAEITASETFPGNGQQRLFYLGNRSLQGIEYIMVDGQYLLQTEYCCHLKNGWVSLNAAPVDSVNIRYRSSPHKDMAVSNWDGATYIFTNTGITKIAGSIAQAPSTISLHSAYPNPFNNMTTIAYSLSEPQFVILKVYDLLGREVQTLVNVKQPAGCYQVAWNAGSFVSGIYFYSIQAGNYIDTRKMILLK